MARYRKVETGTWADERFRELSQNGRMLWLYLLCGPRTTTFPGLVVAREAVAADDLGWSLEAFREAFAEASSKGMAKADWKAGLILLPRALLDSAGDARESAKPESPNVLRGWAKSWSEIPECALKNEYLRALGTFCEALTEAFVEAYREAFRKALTKASPHPSPNQEQEQEQEQDPQTPAPARVKGGGGRSGGGGLHAAPPEPPEDLSSQRTSLFERLLGEHQRRHDALRCELRSTAARRRRRGSDSEWERGLRTVLLGYGADLADAEEECMRALDVAEAEARAKRTLRWFSEDFWRRIPGFRSRTVDDVSESSSVARPRGGAQRRGGVLDAIANAFDDDAEGVMQ